MADSRAWRGLRLPEESFDPEVAAPRGGIVATPITLLAGR